MASFSININNKSTWYLYSQIRWYKLFSSKRGKKKKTGTKMKSQEHINTAQNTMAANTLLPHTLRFIVNEVLHRCLAMSSPYWKYLRPATRKNFSKKTSESRTAMWAARPIREFAVLGKAWITSYRTRLQS